MEKDFFINHLILKWNMLQDEDREAGSMEIFKSRLHKTRRKVKHKYYEIGNRVDNCWLTQLRLDVNPLNYSLFRRTLHPTNLCKCNLIRNNNKGVIEDVWHYFVTCPFYTIARSNLLIVLSEVIGTDFRVHHLGNYIEHLINGHNCLTYDENCKVQLGLQTFINESNRFHLNKLPTELEAL
jgi:hypothetical protein